MPIAAARDLFDIPAHVTYLSHAAMAPHLRSVTEAGKRALESQITPWTRTPSDWFTPAEELRTVIAQLLGATADSIALIPSASYGIATAAANLPISAGQTIALMDHEFPSQFYAWRELAKKNNAHVLPATRNANESWTEALARIIDRNTAIVAVTPCHWTDGARIDLEYIADRARSVGAALVVDASQYFGAAPLHLARIQPDFLACVGYKWLLGVYGLSYLYAAPRWCERGSPLEHTWLARADAEKFATVYRDDFRPGARRFDMGEFPQFTLLPMALAGARQVLEWGIDNIASTLAALTSAAADQASAEGYEVYLPAQRVPHILGIRIPHSRRSNVFSYVQLAAQLAAKEIYVSAPGEALRLSPYLYSFPSDFDRFFSALKSLISA
jgi:selenocysteine lyase/cysteine desulfurase